MSWSNNNRAHTSLWFFEKWHLDQRNTLFTPAGEWGTDFLIKSSAGEPAQERDQKANDHAVLLDNAFTSLFGAEYEAGITQTDAIDRMADVLKNIGNKLKDLGDPVDEMYKFIGEVS